MALSAAIIWEVRTTGSQNNGGGFKAGATGTDFSQQAAAQYALAAVSSGGASAVMNHASAAADMVGNVCRVVSGANATVGWYEILSVVVGVSMTVDRNWCTGACANGVVNVGGAFLLGGVLDDDFFEAMVAGHTVYVAQGTYTLGEVVSQAVNGTAANPFKWIGYVGARNAITVGTNRPLIICGTNDLTFGDHTIVKNLRFTSTSTFGISLANYSLAVNCKCQNTSLAVRAAFTLNSPARLVACEAISDNGPAIVLGSTNTVVCCYVHDSATGIKINAVGGYVNICIVANCGIGIDCLNFYGASLVNNTIWNCTTGIAGTTAHSLNALNNIISECTTGASWGSPIGNCIWDYNCWNNTTDVVNVTKGPHDITADPKLKDPTNADFTLKGGSPCFAAGLSLNSDVGLP